MNTKRYSDIPLQNLLPFTRMIKMKQGQAFQQENDFEHTAKAALNSFQRKKIKAGRMAQSPNLNPTENSWKEVQIRVHRSGPLNLQDSIRRLFLFEEWAKITPEQYI